MMKEKFSKTRSTGHQATSRMKAMSRSPRAKHSADKEHLADIVVEHEQVLKKIESDQQLSLRVSHENLENSVLFDYIAKMDPCRLVPGQSAHIHDLLHKGGDKVEEADLKQLQRDLISTNQMCQRLVTT